MNIYDFDNTIYDGDSSIDFFKFCLKKEKKIILLLPKIIIAMGLYLLKIYEKEKFKSTFFSFVKYFKNIDQVVLEFWQCKDYKLKKFYLDGSQKDDIVISASPEFLLAPVAKHYHFTLIATKVDNKSGKLIGKNCYGEEKVKKLKQANIKVCDEFYSDSLSDLPLAKIAKKAYIVKKDEIILWQDYKPSLKKKIINLLFDRDFFVFLAIGCINAINGVWLALVYSLLIKNAVVAYIFGFFTSLLIAYILNSILNFKSKLSFKKFILFAVNNIPNFIIQVVSVIVLIMILKWPKIIAYGISAIIAVPITFILVKLNVFKK